MLAPLAFLAFFTFSPFFDRRKAATKILKNRGRFRGLFGLFSLFRLSSDSFKFIS